MKRTIPTQIARKRRGATAVEFALVFPVFLLIMFFFFETWRFQEFQQAVDQAALETARAAIVPGTTADEAREKGQQLLDALAAETATITITPTPILESTDEVTVSVELPYADVGLFYPYFTRDYVFTSTLTLETENNRIGRL